MWASKAGLLNLNPSLLCLALSLRPGICSGMVLGLLLELCFCTGRWKLLAPSQFQMACPPGMSRCKGIRLFLADMFQPLVSRGNMSPGA